MKGKAAKRKQFSLNPELSRQVERIARKEGTSLIFVIRRVLKIYLPSVEERGLFNLLEVK